MSRTRLPDERQGITHRVRIEDVHGAHAGYITGNVDGEGRLREVFIHGFGKEGSTQAGWMGVASVMMSIGLQSGMNLADVARKVGVMRFDPSGDTDNPEIPWCPSIPAYFMRWLAERFDEKDVVKELDEKWKEMRG